MDRNSFYNNLNKYKQNDELMHYGTLGQKWGVRKWQNYDGTFNEAGKERYFGKSSKPKTTEEEKVGSNKSNVKDYLKFRNKMLKQRTRSDLNQWYRDKMKDADKQLIKDAKRVDKQQMKMYKNQLKDFYDNPEDLVNDLDRMYRIGSNDKKIGGLFSKTPEEKAEKKAIKEAKELNEEYDDLKNDYRHYDEFVYGIVAENPKFQDLFKNIRESNDKKLEPYYKRMDEIFDDYEKDEIENTAKGGMAAAFIDKGDKTTLEDLANDAWFYVYEDGNQGYANAQSLYARYEKNIEPKEISELSRKLHYNNELIQENVNEMKKDPVLSKVNEKLLRDIAEENDSWHFSSKKDNANYWDLYNADDDSTYNGDLEKNAYKQAKEIANKLKPSCGNTNGWDYFNEAIQNLGLSSTEVKTLSSSDWNKINAEINKLKTK